MPRSTATWEGLLERGRARDPRLLLSRDAFYVGAICLAAGVALGVGVNASGHDVTGALLAGAWTVLAAIVRLVVLAIAVMDLRGRPLAVRGAWSAGLVIWIVAATPTLAFTAWAASAVITYRALVLLGESADTARRAIIAAWGTHAAIVSTVWLARSAIVAALLVT